MLKNTENSYGLVAKILHWIIGFSVIGMITVGFTMTSMGPTTEKFELYGLHKAFGIILFSFIIIRILWRITNKDVLAIDGVPVILRLLAKIEHFLLYTFMLVMPISGILMSRFGGHSISVFNIFTIPALSEKNLELARLFNFTHKLAAKGFILLISIHILAALYHHFIRKDNTFIRMVK